MAREEELGIDLHCGWEFQGAELLRLGMRMPSRPLAQDRDAPGQIDFSRKVEDAEKLRRNMILIWSRGILGRRFSPSCR